MPASGISALSCSAKKQKKRKRPPQRQVLRGVGVLCGLSSVIPGGNICIGGALRGRGCRLRGRLGRGGQRSVQAWVPVSALQSVRVWDSALQSAQVSRSPQAPGWRWPRPHCWPVPRSPRARGWRFRPVQRPAPCDHSVLIAGMLGDGGQRGTVILRDIAVGADVAEQRVHRRAGQVDAVARLHIASLGVAGGAVLEGLGAVQKLPALFLAHLHESLVEFVHLCLVRLWLECCWPIGGIALTTMSALGWR